MELALTLSCLIVLTPLKVLVQCSSLSDSVFFFSAVTRKNEFPLYSLYPVKKVQPSGTQLSRKPSLGKNRPFLHQYEVKGQYKPSSQPSSAPGTPIKSKESGFKRSLSFGGGINPRQLQGSGIHMSPVIGNPSVRSVGSSGTAGRRCECTQLAV